MKDRKLSLARRTTCVGASVEIPTCPTAAVYTVLNILLTEQFASSVTIKRALRLRYLKRKTERNYGHSRRIHSQLRVVDIDIIADRFKMYSEGKLVYYLPHTL